MEHSFSSAFVTSTGTPPLLKSKTSSTPLRSKPKQFNSKQRKKRIEEIQLLQSNIQTYLHHLTSYSKEVLMKALENLSLDESVFRVNLMYGQGQCRELPKGVTEGEIVGEIGFLEKVMGKLNSVGKEVKKVGRYRASLMKRGERGSVMFGLQEGCKAEREEVRNLGKSLSTQEKSFHHIKLLYRKQLGEELERRDKREEIETRQQRTRQILKENNLNKLREKKKKQEELKQKRKIFYQNASLKQAEQLQKVEKKMLAADQIDPILSPNKHENTPANPTNNHLFTRILNFSKSVSSNKLLQQQLQRARLTQLSSTISKKQLKYHLNRRTERVHRSAKASKQNSIQEVIERRLKRDKEKQNYYLATLFERMGYDKELVTKQDKTGKNGERQRLRGQSTEHTINTLPSVVAMQGLPQEQGKKNSPDRSLKKSNILREVSEAIKERNNQNRLIFQKNKETKRKQQEERIEILNNKYHVEKLRAAAVAEERKRQENRHVHNNFKIRCKQDELHEQLQNILNKPSAKELESTLNYIDSGRCRMFESKE